MISRILIGLVGLLMIPAVAGNLTSENLSDTYGTEPVKGAALGLLVHRGIVVTLVGCLLVAAAVWPSFRPGALPLAIAMKITFVIIILTQAPGTQRRILYFDSVAIVVLSAIGSMMVLEHLDRI